MTLAGDLAERSSKRHPTLEQRVTFADGTLTPNVAPVPPDASLNAASLRNAPLLVASHQGKVRNFYRDPTNDDVYAVRGDGTISRATSSRWMTSSSS